MESTKRISVVNFGQRLVLFGQILQGVVANEAIASTDTNNEKVVVTTALAIYREAMERISNGGLGAE